MPLRGQKMTEEHKAKISKAHKSLGENHWMKRKEVSEKVRIKNIGRVGYWAGKKRDDPAYIEKISLAHKGQHSSPATQFKKGQISPRKGQHYPQVAGEKCHFWRGGVSPETKKIRTSLEMKLWRESVFSRDNWTCQNCFVQGGDLHAHHVKPFAQFPELRFAIDNGQTLCIRCHRQKHTQKAG